MGGCGSVCSNKGFVFESTFHIHMGSGSMEGRTGGGNTSLLLSSENGSHISHKLLPTISERQSNLNIHYNTTYFQIQRSQKFPRISSFTYTPSLFIRVHYVLPCCAVYVCVCVVPQTGAALQSHSPLSLSGIMECDSDFLFLFLLLSDQCK